MKKHVDAVKIKLYRIPKTLAQGWGDEGTPTSSPSFRNVGVRTSPQPTSFFAGVSVNDSSYQNKNVAQILSDVVSIRGRIHVHKNHVKLKANIFITVAYRLSENSDEEFLFTVNHLNGLMPWDGKQKTLGNDPFRSGEILQAAHTIKIYDGLLLAKGLVTIRFGYILEDGTVIQSPEGIALTTTD